MGRSAEIELFRAALDDAIDPPFSVLHVHGPGGVGKTSLLQVLGAVAADAGATVARLDGRDLDPSPVGVLEALAETLAVPTGDGPIELPEGGRRLVLLVDAYEHMTALDPWFRARLLPRLPASAIVVVAGRDAPTRAWRGDPAWGALLRVVSLRNLDPDDSRAFLRRAGIDRDLHERILRLTYGHPLGLALLADVVARGGQVDSEVLPLGLVDVLLERLVERVPDRRHRRVLAACVVARCTTEALVRDVLEESDVHDVFAWLRDLSFVEPRTDGVAPHDLARDVLDADLRWRDFDSYADVFRKVREHSLASTRTVTGRGQLRAIFDLKWLFRQARSAMAPVEWGSWGEYYPERARDEDRGPILDLVRSWEGEQSAAYAKRWLDRQPEGFHVIRKLDGELQGMLAIVDLARSSPDDRDADPGARAAWDFAGSAPPRPGEAFTVCRFVVDRDNYQGPSPTLNAVPIVTMQKQLSTPNLAWDFVALADPDRWDEYFAMGDLPRAEGADFTVGDRRYGLFAHDFRKVPVDAWIDLWSERALAQDVDAGTPRERAPAFLVLSHPDFEAAVRQGFKDLRRPGLLARNPLLRTRLVADHTAGEASSAAVLQAVLREAAMTLARHPRDDKLLRAVDRTYLRPAATQESAAAALGLPFSTYRRHLTQGMTRVVSVLWDQEVYGPDRTAVSTS